MSGRYLPTGSSNLASRVVHAKGTMSDQTPPAWIDDTDDQPDAAVFGVNPRGEHGSDRIVGRRARVLRGCGRRNKPDHKQKAELCSDAHRAPLLKLANLRSGPAVLVSVSGTKPLRQTAILKAVVLTLRSPAGACASS